MKNHDQTQQCRQKWLRKPIASGAYRHWLMTTGSLTRKIQQKYTNFSVSVLSMQTTKPLLGENQRLKLINRTQSIVRDVCLIGDGKSVVFAHSIMPHQSLRGVWVRLKNLGNQPLGASLFANPRTQRMGMEFRKLPRHDALYKRAHAKLYVLNDNHTELLWARRSIFKLSHGNIMVTEVFLPQILKK